MADGEINRNGATIRIDDDGGVQVEPADGQEVEYTGPDRGTDAIRDSVNTEQVRSKEEPVFDVREWGAVGDGSTDDYQAIQDAIDAAELVGGAVEFGNSDYTYYIGDIPTVSDSDVTLRADGATIQTDEDIHGLLIKGPETADEGDWIGNIRVEGLRLVGDEGQDIDASPTGIWTGPSGIEVQFAKNVTIDDVVVDTWAYDAIGIPQAARNVTAKDSKLRNCTDDGWNPGGIPGSQIESVYECKAIRLDISGMTGVGLHHSGGCIDAVSRDCTVRDCGVAMDFTTVERVATSENTLENDSGMVVDVRPPAEDVSINDTVRLTGGDHIAVYVRDSAKDIEIDGRIESASEDENAVRVESDDGPVDVKARIDGGQNNVSARNTDRLSVMGAHLSGAVDNAVIVSGESDVFKISDVVAESANIRILNDDTTNAQVTDNILMDGIVDDGSGEATTANNIEGGA